MIIAAEKKKNNIAEYILYMWQIEDLIRSHSFNLNLIKSNIIDSFDVPLPVKIEMENWYAGLIQDMKSEGIETKGHLAMISQQLHDLDKLHKLLLTVNQDKLYQDLYESAKPAIDNLMAKSGGTVSSEIEACLTALYGLMVLKLKKAEISAETLSAMRTFSKLLAYLSKTYHSRQKGGELLTEERKN